MDFFDFFEKRREGKKQMINLENIILNETSFETIFRETRIDHIEIRIINKN